MRHSKSITPQFYVTAPQPCPYLEGQVERKLFTAPSCADCSACLSARVRVADFEPSASQRRILRKNEGFVREGNAPWATEDQYALFRRYLDQRHRDGGMAEMDVYEYAAMVEETPVRSRIVEYSERDEDGRAELQAVALTDVLADGLSMVYSFFDPDLAPRSPGSYIILDHIEIARAAGLPYVYLGYWVTGSQKMDYKKNFKPLEVFFNGKWRDLDDYLDLSSQDKRPLKGDLDLTLLPEVPASR